MTALPPDPPRVRRASDDPFHDPATRLGLALDAAGMGDWSWDFHTDRVTFSERCSQIFGVPAGETLTWTQMREYLHPEDAERARIAVEASMRNRSDYAIEYRILNEGKYDRWISARGCAMYDAAGNPRGMLGVVQDVTERKRMEEALRLRGETLETVNRTALLISAELDLTKLVAAVTDAATQLTGAAFGAFFYNVLDEKGASYTLYHLSGVDHSHFENFPMPRATAVFGPTFRGEGVIRLDDVTRDPRYGLSAPYHGMPSGHLPVASYLAVPVMTRAGEVLGGLFFGHPLPAMFTAAHETIVVALAAQAAVALDNARLYEQASVARAAASHGEAEVRKSRDVLTLAMRAGRMGVWSRQLHDDSVWWSRELEEIFGLPPGGFGGSKDAFINLVHPDDRPAVLEGVRKAIETRQDYSIEFRFKHASGEWRWMDGRGQAVYDASGKATTVYGLGVDITERMQSVAKLKEADTRKSEFLAVLAHELRNPLAPIRNAVEFLQRRGPPDAELVNARAIIGRQVTHLVRLVDDLLDVSRISRGRINLKKTWITLSMIVANAVEVARPLISQQQHQLEIELPEQPVHLEGDLTRLAQVLQNLLTNAAKYTPPGGKLRIVGRLEDSDLALRVSDNGSGIPQHLLADIFEMFVQADRTLERTSGGLGIGLTLVQRIVEMHGGTVQAHSEGPGRGSEFTVRLPASANPFGEAQMLEAPAPQPAARPLRVVVVDDNHDSAETLGMLLELQGHQVHKAYDGAEGVAAVQSFKPDVALFDIGLPRLNGYDAARQIRALPGGVDLTLVAITGWGQEEDRRRSQAAGFDHHLVKPISPDALSALLQGHGARPASKSEP